LLTILFIYFNFSEIADDFASDYLKNADNMSESELKRLREDLRKKIGRSKKGRKYSEDDEKRDRKKSRTSSEDERKSRSRPSRTVTFSKSKNSREKSSPSVVFNPATKKYEKNIKRGEKNALSDGESDEGEIKDEKITADDLINELINDETNETDLKLVTDVIMESSKNRKSTTKNGDSHRRVQKLKKKRVKKLNFSGKITILWSTQISLKIGCGK
jgi:hypothetical protein